MLVDLSATEKPAQIQANLIAYMRLFAGLPGMVIADHPETFWVVSEGSSPGTNVLRACWQSGSVEDSIDEMLAEIANHTHHIDWLVFPCDQPPDLNRRLEARGMPSGPGGIWLWADLTSPSTPPAVPRDFHVEQVKNNEQMKEWVRLSEAGFGAGPGQLACYYDAYARHGYGPEAFSLHYTGYLGSSPVTTGTLLDAGGCASIYDVSTPPIFRRMGFGSAITYALMLEIRQRGYTDSWLWSSDIGKPVYQKLGYVEADFGVREHKWHLPAQ